MSQTSDQQYGSFRMGRAQEVFEAVTRHSGDCVALLDLDGVVLRWNNACEELYGSSAREVIGRRLPHIPEDQRLRTLRALRAAAGSPGVTEHDVESLRADGTRAVMRTTIIPVHDEDGDPAGVVAIAREMLGDERVERQREELATFIGERLSEPLRTIVTAADLLKRPEVMSDPSRRSRLADLVARHAREAASLVDDLLLTSRIASGDLVLDREPTDLGHVVSGAVGELPGAEQRVIIDFDPDLTPVLVDVARIQRAVRVLVGLVLEATSGDGQVHVSVSRHGDEVEVRVGRESDAVEGAASARASAARTEAHDEGIGLHLARGVAEAHGGRVNVAGSDGTAYVLTLHVDGARAPRGGTDG